MTRGDRRRQRVRALQGLRSGRVDQLLVVALVAGVAVPAFALGGVHSTVLAVFAVIACSGITLWCWTQRHRLPTPALGLLVLTAWCLLQALPLPASWVGAMNPNIAEVWARAFRPFHEAAPAFVPLSGDASASVREAAKWFAYAGVFVLASHVGRTRSVKWMLRLVLALSLALALITIMHGLLDATKVYGIYQPLHGRRDWHVAPLLNPNNFAGLLNMGVLSGLGLLLGDTRRPKGLVALSTAIVIGVEIMTASRGGQAALAISAVVFVVLGVLVGRRASAQKGESLSLPRTASLAAGAVLVLGAGASLAAMSATDETLRELREGGLEKISLIAWSYPVLEDHVWFGVGRGAFETIFPQYRASGATIYTHPENLIVQWVVEWGVPVGLLAVAFFCWTLRPSRLGVTRSVSALAAYMAVMAVVLQNLVDLSLEVPAVSALAFALLGACHGAKAEADGSKETKRRKSRGIVCGAAAAATLGLLGAYGWHTPIASRGLVHNQYDELVAGKLSTEAFYRGLRRAIARHPGDPYFPRLGAIAAYRSRSDPMIWIQRALERSMTSSRTHYLLAQLLMARSQSQAMLHLRLAVTYEPSLAPAAAKLVQEQVHDVDLLLRTAPDGASGAAFLVAVAKDLKAADARARLLNEAVSRDPGSVNAHTLLVTAILELLRGGPCPVTVGSCEARARASIRQVASLEPEYGRAHELEADLLAAEGRQDEGLQLLARECVRLVRRGPCLRAWVRYSRAMGREAAFEEAAKALFKFDCGRNAQACAETATWLADIEMTRARWFSATTYLERAVREAPTVARYRKLALAAEKADMPALSARARESAARFGVP